MLKKAVTAFKPMPRPWPTVRRWGRWLAPLTLGLAMAVGDGAAARPRKTVLLQHNAQSTQIPLADLQQLARTSRTSDVLQAYLATIPLTAPDLAALLNFEIYTGSIPLSSSNVDFAAVQIGRVIGEPLRRERQADMRSALVAAFEDDRQVTVLEILEEYPGDEVRIGLAQIDALFSDLALFLDRIDPVLAVVQQLLPELVCDCGFEGGATAATPAVLKVAKAGLPECDRPPALKQAEDTVEPEVQRHRPAPISERIVIDFGPLRPSFAVADLENFVETGELPRAWRFYFRVAGLSPEEFRQALTQEVTVDFLFLDGLLNNILGEYILFQAGSVIHTRSERNNIQALRAALVRSAADDNRISLFEFLRNYPQQSVILEGLNLARFGSNLSRDGAVQTATAGLEDMLLELQGSIADQVCNCEDEAAEPVSGDRPPPP
ncbi:MAG: alpha/beta hydrolase [Cyanobacteria bacterium P01_A01_bin.135]